MGSRGRGALSCAAIALAVSGPALASGAAAGPVAGSAKFHLTSALITPGRSIGNLKLGMTIPQVAAYLGSGERISKPQSIVSYYLYGAMAQYTVLFYGHPRAAVAIGERNGAMHTASGIGLGSSLAHLQAHYAVQCDTGVKEAYKEEEATGYCDLHGPAGRATRFVIRNGEVGVVGVGLNRWISQLK